MMATVGGRRKVAIGLSPVQLRNQMVTIESLSGSPPSTSPR